ncbi:MAG TPA: adenosylmethionine--8-amino-7-oxononanoate transaminase [Methylomirabilota bacterium]|nr:adenosylmethionine--8-amino-7-oxononanoate transaminase [Methylomirabilota bacterium]
MHELARLDQRHVWHPFTQMSDWAKREPIVIVSGKGAVLRDARGREYLDANASIWTNLHGHNHPRINAAIRAQLNRIAHSSALGFANEPASLLAERLVNAANPPALTRGRSAGRRLEKVFYSDDGSTAMEVALKLAYEFARRSGRSRRPRFLSLENAYHGDTVGAVSLGHVDLFHKSWRGLLFGSDRVMAPYCYRCPYNRAKPERGDAREYRRCHWECVDEVERRFKAQRKRGNPYAAMVVEPVIQGVAGMVAHPGGWLRRVDQIVRGDGAQWIADEVMTGFGRTGVPGEGEGKGAGLFASHREGVQPDYLALAKGLTGGYLPMAATLTTRAVFDAFLGGYEEFKTFFHGHSFTGNQLGAAAARASLDLLERPAGIRARQRLERTFRDELSRLWELPRVGDVRQAGLVAGVELVKDWRTRKPFDLRERAGIRVCEAMAKRGVLTRPIGNVIVLMPPYCATAAQVSRMVGALSESVNEVLRAPKGSVLGIDHSRKM